MEEIKIGEYIRTKDGVIAKVTDTGYGIDCDRDVFDLKCLQMMEIPPEHVQEYVIKHSFNIIDVIEEGDFVELEYYVSKYRKRISRVFEISKIDGWQFVGLENEHCHFTYDLEKNRWLDGKGYNPKIKSIVTKEQFKAMEYEVK